MSLQSRFSLQFALTAGLGVALSLAASLAMFGMRVDDMSASFRGTLEAALERQVRRDGELALEKLSGDIATALTDYDRTALARAAAAGMAASGANSVRIYDSRGRGLADGAGDARALADQPPARLRGIDAADGVVRWREGEELLAGKAVCIRDACVGTIVVAVDGTGMAEARAGIEQELDAVESGFFGRFLMLGIAAFAVVTLVAALTGYLLGHRLTKGLHAAIRALERLANGATNVKVDRDGATLRELADAVETLSEKLATGRGNEDAIVAEMADGLFVARADGEMVIANPAFHALFGTAPPALVGADAFATFRLDPAPTPEAFVTAVSGVTEIHTFDGRDVAVMVSAALSRGDAPGDARVIGVARDVSEQAVREQELQTARLRAAAAEKAKSEFLAVMSHELRTPLNGVLGGAAVLAGSQLDPNQKRFVGIVQHSGKALLSLISNILDFSRIESGAEEVESAPVDLDALVHDIAASVADQAAAKGLALNIHVQPGAPAIMGDRDKLLRIGTSLAENAVKFTDEGHVAIELTHALRGEKVAVSLAVADTGKGIAPEAQSAIFDRFTQGDSSATRAHGGAGLGLTMAQKLSGLMGGSISLDSSAGDGATFTLALDAPRVPQAGTGPATLARTRSLVVDPALRERETVAGQLAEAGASVETAETAAQALGMLDAARAQGTPFDLVVHPADLPDLAESGLQAALDSDDPARRVASLARTRDGAPGGPGRAAHALSAPARATAAKLIAAAGAAVARWRASYRDAPTSAPARVAAAVEDVERHDVVLAEDNEVNRIVLGAYLRKAGFTCHTAANGFEAVRLYKEVNPCLVLMTVTMPLMNGLDATKAIRQYEAENKLPPIPVIGLGGQPREGDKERSSAAGMNDTLVKPVKIDELEAKLERWTELFGQRARASLAS